MTETTAFCTFLTALVVSVVLLYKVLAVLTPVSVELVKDTPAAVSRIKAPSKPPSKPITSIAIGATIFFQLNFFTFSPPF